MKNLTLLCLGAVTVFLSACATQESSPKGDRASGTANTRSSQQTVAPSSTPNNTIDLSGKELPKAKARVQPVPEVSREIKSSYKSAIKSMNKGIKNQDFADALEKLTELELQNPELSGPSTNIGIIHLHLGDFEKAEEAFKRALAINNENEYAHNNLGLAYREQGKFAEAKSSYTEAAALKPLYAEAHYNLGILAELYLNDLELALQSFEYYTLASRPSEDQQVNTWMIDLKNRIQINKPPITDTSEEKEAPPAEELESEVVVEDANAKNETETLDEVAGEAKDTVEASTTIEE